MKKFVVLALISVFLSALAGFACVLTFKANYISASNSKISGQSSAPMLSRVKSFQGDLKDVLQEIQGKPVAEKKEVAEPIPNPFANKNSGSPAPEEESWSFGVIGDTQNFNVENPSGYFQRAVKSLRTLKPSFSISVGDLFKKCSGQDSCERDLKYWKSIAEGSGAKVYVVQGNHDRKGGSGEADKDWRNNFDFPVNGPTGFSEITYSFDFKNVHFVVLASDNPRQHIVNDVQRTWLEKDLAANKKENTFIFFHEPAFPTYEVVGQSLDNQPSERDALWQILDKYNVTAVFNGHEHMISRRLIDSKIVPKAKNSIFQFVFGNTDSFDQNLPQSGIVQYASSGQGQFGLVKVKGREITIESRGPDGALLDKFSYHK